MQRIFKLRKLFFTLLALNFALVIAIPLFFDRPLFGLDEKFVDMIVSGLLLLIAYTVNFLYLREVGRLHRYQVNLEDRLQETFKYIGSVNLQMEEMREAFANFKKYPENRKDIRAVFAYFAEKILGIVNADWVSLRIIDIRNSHTVREDKFSRNNQNIAAVKIDNGDILAGKCKLENCTIIKSDQENLDIKACCILPAKLAGRDQEFFVRSMINQLEMLFIVFSSLHRGKKIAAKAQVKK